MKVSLFYIGVATPDKQMKQVGIIAKDVHQAIDYFNDHPDEMPAGVFAGVSVFHEETFLAGSIVDFE